MVQILNPGMKNLTHTEKEIITLLADGLTLNEMSERLKMNVSTIETYRHRLFRKINVNNAPHCVAWAFRNKVLN